MTSLDRRPDTDAMSARAVGVRAESFGWRHPGRRNWALRNVNLTIRPGERVLIAGSSGVGKSTLLRALADIVDADDAAEAEGSIRYELDGAAVSSETARAHTGFMMQDPETNLLLTRVGDDVAFGLENACVSPEQIWPRVRQALADVGFRYSLDRPTSALSGGEKQRVALAAMLARRPGLLILDEPTANLDPAGATSTLAALGRALDQDPITLIVVEHRLERIVGLLDRLVLLSPDGVVADGPIERVIEERRQLLRDNGVFVPGIGPATDLPGPAEPKDTIALRARDVTVQRRRGMPLALDGVDLTSTGAGATAVIGANGAGKSTLARVLGGLLAPTRGAAWVEGNKTPLHKVRAQALAAQVGSVFQEPDHQFVSESVRGEMQVGAHVLGLSKQQAAQRADSILSQLGLTHLAEVNPYTMSGGEKRRLAVGVAMVGRPSALILDEPTFGQDANSWRAIVELLLQQLESGISIVVVTHDLDLISALGAATVTLVEGRVAPADPAPFATGAPQ